MHRSDRAASAIADALDSFYPRQIEITNNGTCTAADAGDCILFATDYGSWFQVTGLVLWDVPPSPGLLEAVNDCNFSFVGTVFVRPGGENGQVWIGWRYKGHKSWVDPGSAFVSDLVRFSPQLVAQVREALQPFGGSPHLGFEPGAVTAASLSLL